MTLEMKPCPFCNENAEAVVFCQGNERIMVKVRCSNCKIGFHDTVESGASYDVLQAALEYALDDWNRRVCNG